MRHNNSCSSRLYSLDTIKSVAAFAIVMLHFNVVNGTFGTEYTHVIRALSRFAVPFFFMVSGYFLPVILENRKHRNYIRRILKLTLTATMLYLFYHAADAYLKGGMGGVIYYFDFYFVPKRLASAVFWGYVPSTTHLWYLGALLYAVLIYVCMNSIRPLQSYILYITIIALLMIVSWNINGLINPDINIRSTRSWIEGIACIGLGAIVGYYNIPQKLRVHVWHLIVVAIVSVIQYELVLHCFNVTLEINMTSILLSLLILIYAVNHPYFGHNCIINKIGLHHSTTIYIIHIIIGNELGHLALRHSWWQQVLFPILVFLVSWVCACLWKIISKYAGELINTQKG